MDAKKHVAEATTEVRSKFVSMVQQFSAAFPNLYAAIATPFVRAYNAYERWECQDFATRKARMAQLMTNFGAECLRTSQRAHELALEELTRRVKDALRGNNLPEDDDLVKLEQQLKRTEQREREAAMPVWRQTVAMAGDENADIEIPQGRNYGKWIFAGIATIAVVTLENVFGYSVWALGLNPYVARGLSALSVFVVTVQFAMTSHTMRPLMAHFEALRRFAKLNPSGQHPEGFEVAPMSRSDKTWAQLSLAVSVILSVAFLIARLYIARDGGKASDLFGVAGILIVGGLWAMVDYKWLASEYTKRQYNTLASVLEALGVVQKEKADILAKIQAKDPATVHELQVQAVRAATKMYTTAMVKVEGVLTAKAQAADVDRDALLTDFLRYDEDAEAFAIGYRDMVNDAVAAVVKENDLEGDEMPSAAAIDEAVKAFVQGLNRKYVDDAFVDTLRTFHFEPQFTSERIFDFRPVLNELRRRFAIPQGAGHLPETGGRNRRLGPGNPTVVDAQVVDEGK